MAQDPFSLAERLAADTAFVADLALSRLLLMDNRLFPWLILVPRRAGITELHHLPPAERAALVEEAVAASGLIERLDAPDKVNIGLLGNLVPQLHLHVVGRRRGDAAWPGPVWGAAREAYAPAERDERVARLRAALGCGAD